MPGNQLTPGSVYVISVFNNDYVILEPFTSTLGFFVEAYDGSVPLHPYMSILLGVTAAVIPCPTVMLFKRVIAGLGMGPWPWWLKGSPRGCRFYIFDG